MKRFIALVLAATLVVGMPIMATAAPSPSASDYQPSTSSTPSTPAPKKNAPANTVESVEGYPELVETGQVGDILVDGEASDIKIEVTKPDKADVELGKSLATTITGAKLISCVGTKSTVADFGSALVIFKLKGVKANAKIICYELVGDQWVVVPVPIVVDNFVVVNLKNPGKLMFMELPAELPTEPIA